MRCRTRAPLRRSAELRGRCTLEAERARDEEAVGVFTTDRELVVRSWDPWLEQATGLREAEVCGHPLAELFPEVEERGLLARLRRVVDTGAVEVLAPAFHRYLIPCPPRGPSAHFARMQQHVTMSPLRARDAIAGVVVTVEDVTARLERERALAAELRSGDESVRLRAARAATEERARPALLGDVLGDESWRVRQAAAAGLAAAADSSAVDLLIGAIRDRHRDPSVLNAAVTALIRSSHEVFPRIAELLGDGDADVRTYAALALGQLGDLRGVEPLTKLLDDPDRNVRYHATEALGLLGDRAAAPALCALALGDDEYLAFAALDALGALAEPSVAPRILPLLDNEKLRAAAAAALGCLGDEEVAPALAARLDQGGPDAIALAAALSQLYRRLHATSGLGELVCDAARGSVSAAGARALASAIPAASDAELDALVRVLGWLEFEGIPELIAPLLEHPHVRRTTAQALVQHAGASVPVLVRALASEEWQTRKTAAQALGEIGNAGAVPALCVQLQGPPEVAIVAAGALGAIGDRRAFEPLFAQLDHPEAAVRQAAIAAIHSIGHPGTRERVRELVSDASPRVRESAVRIAGYFGYPEALDLLLERCGDLDELVRRAAVEHIAFFNDPRVAPALAGALADTAGVRAAAARALAHAQSGEALSLLERALADADVWVRYHAVRSAAVRRGAPLLARLSEIALTDPAPPVRLAAAEALGEMREAAAATALCLLAGNAAADVARVAVVALGRTPGAEAFAGLVAALDTSGTAVQVAALAALGERGEAPAVAPIRALAERTADGETLEAALCALGRIGGAEAVEALLAACANPAGQRAAVDALAGLRPGDLQQLSKALRHPDARVRRSVVEALARRRDGLAAPVLAGALEDPLPAIRFAAAHALRRLDLRAVQNKLELLARSDEDAGVREAAQSALHR